ncbi:contractile injection system protein, VgrG/Pvc8 family [Halomonas sp. CS7]|uniref:Contractile injection system protein, VgrG/Pvc8 family n=1 Tax=Halomonas pelophila TaxID=3151122 RepID=A0ABV1N2G8_9GAMM
MVLDQYHHGVRVSEVNDSTRTIRTESMAIISIICAAPDAAPGNAAALTLNQSAAWPLIEGSGTYYGLYVIVSLNERKSDFFRDGAAQQIEFDLKLERIDRPAGQHGRHARPGHRSEWSTGMSLLSEPGRAARTPDYRLTLMGQRISPQVGARLQHLRLTDRRGLEADQLDLTLEDHDGRLALPPRGAELHLAMGWRGQPLVDRGTYIVEEVEHSGAPDVITIRARSADMRQGLPGKRTQSWDAITLGEIITTIAGRHDLEPRTGQHFQGIYLEHIDQTEDSDLHFLTRMAERYDAIATVKAGRLLFIPEGTGTNADGTEIPAIRLTRQAGDQHRYSVTDRDAYTGVVAQWYHPANAEPREVVAGSDDEPKRLRPTYATQADALAAAESEWQRLQRGGAAFTLDLAEGRPELYPETPVTLSGWKREIDDNVWLITEVSHDLSDNGYTCSLLFERHPV